MTTPSLPRLLLFLKFKSSPYKAIQNSQSQYVSPYWSSVPLLVLIDAATALDAERRRPLKTDGVDVVGKTIWEIILQ
jgi:hypothetical protein